MLESMKVALLHYSSWPVVGGVENVIRDQANMLMHAGHSVKVLSGEGLDTGDGYEFQLLPQLASDFELNQGLRAVLERGQTDSRFTQYRTMLVDVLRAALDEVNFTLVHNIFTMHHNLALT